MTSADQIIGFLDELLAPSDFEDYGPNGLQVPGRGEVQTVVTGVSAGADLFSRAAELDAGLVLVHHGLFWGARGALDRAEKRRLQLLFDADIGLAAYHLPLDAHLEVGNNAILARELGAAGVRPFGRVRGKAIGVRARFGGDGVEPDDLVARVERVTGRVPLAFTDGPSRVRSIGIVSGAGADQLDEAIAADLDAFLTGEPSERSMLRARESEVHFIAAGHYATETFGVRALGEALAERFGVHHAFVDVPNPI